MSAMSFFSDDPVDGSSSAPDLLGRRRYARTAADLVRRVRAQSESSVLALVGAWGSGKSSVLAMALDALREDSSGAEPWVIVEINPWLFPDLESLATGLFAEIRAVLPKNGSKWKRARSSLGEFTKATAPLGSLVGVVGVNASGPMKWIGERLAGDMSVNAAKREVEAALREAATPILVVMDDLDRLTPDELLLVFKLVRLAGRLPNIHYLLSYDERTLLDVLTRSDLVGGEESRAREFLEKIVQVRLDLPAFREKEAGELMNGYLGELLNRHGKLLTSTDQSRLGEAYTAYLQERLQTPRAIKRFMGQADASLGSVVKDVDFVDFLLMTFLRTMEPGVYAMVKRHRGELTGNAHIPQSNSANTHELWQTRVKHAGVTAEHVDGILGVLGMLFTPVADVLESWQATAASNADERHGVGSDDYFDRYTTFGVPEDDLPEEMFEHGLRQILASQTGDAATSLIEHLRSDTRRIVRRIEQRLPLSRSPQGQALLALLADEYANVQGPAEGLGLLRPQAAVEILSRRVLADIPNDQRLNTLVRMAHTADGSVLAVITLHNTVYPSGQPASDLATDPGIPEWAGNARAPLAAQIADHLRSAADQGADKISPAQRELLRGWAMLIPDQASEWVRAQLDAGKWELLDLLVSLSPRKLLHGLPILEDVDLKTFDVLIGLDRIMVDLAAEIAAAPIQLPLTTTLATPDLDRKHVLSSLRRYRDQAPDQPQPPTQ